MSQAQRHARPLNRSESQARTRAALLDAAEALIVEHSIPALSLRAVCTRAGYTQGAFYSNFADREELLLEVMERNLEQKAASLEQMLATCGDAGLDGTLACILDWLDTIHHRGEWARIAMELGYKYKAMKWLNGAEKKDRYALSLRLGLYGQRERKSHENHSHSVAGRSIYASYGFGRYRRVVCEEKCGCRDKTAGKIC